MFQQFLGFDYGAPTIYAGLYPTGGRHDPCVVKCSLCKWTTTAPNWTAAANLAGRHDWEHDKQKGKVPHDQTRDRVPGADSSGL